MAVMQLDVLCIGHASYDLVFSVPYHPAADEKTVADALLSCGGGPAANAAVQISKLGFRSGFCGYLGRDVYGDSHCQELMQHSVSIDLLVRGSLPTPLSAVLVKPDGKRALINYKGETRALAAEQVDINPLQAKVLLLDGHEPYISLKCVTQYANIPSVLDAGSWHAGTEMLLDKVDYPVCSEKFAIQFAGSPENALQQLAQRHPAVVITLGERGLIWRRGIEQGSMQAPPIVAVDTTGAGDAFHGAFAAGLAAGMPWLQLLRYASATGGLCCTQLGARTGLPDQYAVAALLAAWQAEA